MSDRFWLPAVFVALALLSSGSQAQELATRGDDLGAGRPGPTSRHLFTGIAVLPGGEPAAGAVVITSAGGNAVCAADGTFSIAVEIPTAAQTVEVAVVATAADPGSGNLTATIAVQPGAPGSADYVGVLQLGSGGDCAPAWIGEFGGEPGTSGSVSALAVFNDGSGPALYMGGQIQAAGGIVTNGVAKWNGSDWLPLGSGLDGSLVFVGTMTVFDDGSGPALFVGGTFSSAGGVAVNNVAKWDGTNWSALGSGLTGGTFVHSMLVYDDGTGPALYVGGIFTMAGGSAANAIAKWNGTSWSAVGTGMSGGALTGVFDLRAFNDGGGQALYAGGEFTTAGGVSASRIAKWNGSSWSALGSGLNARVNALEVHGSGGTSALFAAGEFTTAGGTSANFIARWNGSSWSALGSGTSAVIFDLAIYDDGSGRALYAGGNFLTAGGVSASRVAKWNGSAWSALAGGVGDALSGNVSELSVFNDGSGPALIAGGQFKLANGNVPAHSIAKWKASTWGAFGVGMTNTVTSIAFFDDGAGQALYAGGYFVFAGASAANRIAKWNGTSWSTLGSGMDSEVNALTVFNDGSGPALYAGGTFTIAGGVATSRIAKWNGTSWSPLGSGVNGPVYSLRVFDDGGGSKLYVGGNFTTAGGASAARIAKWDGTNWSALGSGINGNVFSLGVYNDGAGAKLYAGGSFTVAGGVSAVRIAKWDGSSWSALGSGMNGFNGVTCLATFRDTSGIALYAGGDFTTAGGVTALAIAKWNGTTWSAVGSGINGGVHALHTWDDGNGSALYAGGDFAVAGGMTANNIAKWNGTSWSPLGPGVLYGGNAEIRALVGITMGGLRYLYMGGGLLVSPAGDSFLAKWGGCP